MSHGPVIEQGKPMTRSMADGGMEPSGWPDPDPDHELTWRQQRILQVIKDFAERCRYAPTLREIGEAAELSSASSVSYQLAILQRKGFLRRTADHRATPARAASRPLGGRGPGGRSEPPVPRPRLCCCPPSRPDRRRASKHDRADHRGHVGSAHRGHMGPAQGPRRRRDTIPPPRPR